MTKGELVKQIGIVGSFDYSLPQGWLDETSTTVARELMIDRNKAYWTIMTGTVWYYGDSIMGIPIALTPEAIEYLESAGIDGDYRG